MMDKHWSDEDVLEDIDKVRDHLARRFKVLTSFERYVADFDLSSTCLRVLGVFERKFNICLGEE